MKNLYFLMVLGCTAFSQAHADTAYRNAQTKSQAEGQYLSAFWKEAQISHAFVDAFSEPAKTLTMGKSGSARIVDFAANASIEDKQTLSASFDRSVDNPSPK